jgi:MFS family permease
LLDLYGDPNATWIAGTAAAVFAGARIVGGFIATRVSSLFSHRSGALAAAAAVEAAALVVVGITTNFWIALLALVLASVTLAAAMPIRQTLINSLIPSAQRATVLSFDGLMGSTGGVVIQPALGRATDVWSYGAAYIIGGAIHLFVVPMLMGIRRLNLKEDETNSAAAGES